MAKGSELLNALAAEHLVALGSLAADPAFCPSDAHTLVLIGPEGAAGWWRHVISSPEWDGKPDPVDRWSRRVLEHLARHFGGLALFPSDGPPYPPFQAWAQATGRIWQSPAGLLVHTEAGLWVSFRGALALPFPLPLPAAESPCLTCAAKPCLHACPVRALGGDGGYDVQACHEYLDRPAGQDCLNHGCAARRACPASHGHARLSAQSAYHMGQFHR